MVLSDDTISRLRGLARQTVAQVIVDGRPKGTAFFVTDRLLLTCTHVIDGAVGLEVTPIGRARRTARLIGSSPVAEVDVALLAVAPVPGEPLQPSVFLYDRLDDVGRPYVMGFPKEQGGESGFEMFEVEANERLAIDGSAQRLTIQGGKQISPGLSGGPVLSTATGAVTAIVRMSKDPNDILGGSAIAISQAAAALPELALLLKDSPQSVIPWRDILGYDHWVSLNRPWDLRARIDLTLGGAMSRWTVQTSAPGSEKVSVTGSDLGEEITDAMFRWAQRRRATLHEEVALLGRLLARALLPPSVIAQLLPLSASDQLVIRLHFEPDNKLADVPWELTAVPSEALPPGSSDKFLAAESRYRLVRVAEGALGPPRPATADARVLAVIGLPTAWSPGDFPQLNRGGNSDPWPATKDIAARLSRDLNSTPLTAELLGTKDAPAEPAAVQRALDTRTFRMLHWIGVGKLGLDGRPQLSLTSDDNTSENWVRAAELFDWAVRGHVDVVVLEFVPSPLRMIAEPVTPSALGAVVPPALSALVYTRFPVHPKQFQGFNRNLYQSLSQGETLETAVQLARANLATNNSIDDAALFGWFTVMTGGQSDVRIIVASRDKGQSPDARQNAPTEESPVRHRPPTSPDGFQR